MGKGAAKKISAIPMGVIVNIHMWEGLLYKAQRDLGDVLKLILDGDDTPDLWADLDKFRKQSVFYSQEYTKAILNMQKSQKRG
jgi:hypothetical protein